MVLATSYGCTYRAKRLVACTNVRAVSGHDNVIRFHGLLDHARSLYSKKRKNLQYCMEYAYILVLYICTCKMNFWSSHIFELIYLIVVVLAFDPDYIMIFHVTCVCCASVFTTRCLAHAQKSNQNTSLWRGSL